MPHISECEPINAKQTLPTAKSQLEAVCRMYCHWKSPLRIAPPRGTPSLMINSLGETIP